MQAMMLYPMFAMVVLTIVVGVLMVKQRYRAVMEGGVSPAYFKLNRGGRLPDYLVRTSQHYENLFETPLLFYVGVLSIQVLQQADAIYLLLSWLYVLSRLAHAYVHIVINRLKLRRRVFLVSVWLLVFIWLRLAAELLIT
jgi:hypothetical protein